jgi:hypothetical protein
LREFAPRFFHQLLELRAFRSQAALQGPGAQVQFARHPAELTAGRRGCRPRLDLYPAQRWSIS